MRCRSSYQSTALGSPKSKVSRKPYHWASWLAGFSFLATAGALWLDRGVGRAEYLAQNTNQGSAVSAVNVLYVNPAVGNDTTGNGTVRQPFKTITNALRAAGRNTVILLAPGTYSTSSGETFPLLLKTAVTIEGNPRARGQDIAIKGGGVFESPTAGRQNVTIVGATQAGLTGVTVTNPNERGYGLWIESSSPVVVDNTFTGNTQDGISVNGNSAPLIRSNYFYENGVVGIAISGASRPEVRDNVLSNMALGIGVTQNAVPRLLGNRISGNKDGVVVEGNAQPVFRNNIIINNQQDGLVAIASSRPDLGTQSESGGNTFRGNGRFEISNKTSSEIVAAFGNQLTNRTEGRITLAGESSVAASNPSSPARGSSAPTLNQQPKINNQQPTTPASPPSQVANRPVVTPTPAASPPSQVANRPPALNPPVSSRQQEKPLQFLSLTSLGNSPSFTPVKPTSPSSQPSAVRGAADNGQGTTGNGQQTRVPSVSASSFPVPTGLNTQTPVGSSNGQPTPSTTPGVTNPQPTANKISTPTALNTQTPVGGSNGQPTPSTTPGITNPQLTPEAGREITFEMSSPMPATGNSPTSNNGPLSSPPQSNQPGQTPTSGSASPQLPVLTASPLPSQAQENNQTGNSSPTPSQNTPPGNTGNTATQASPPGVEAQGKKPDSSVSPSAPGQRYRVVVQVNSDKQKAMVRSLVPNAFRTVLKGRAVMQVGVYSDRAYAEQILQMFKSKGLTAIIEPVK